MTDDRKILEVHGWHTQCGACGYGRGGWASSPANQGKPILTPESTVCHGCQCVFTHIDEVYNLDPPQPIQEIQDAA